MLNKWIGQGRLTRDIELMYTDDGVAWARFTLASERDYKPKSGEREADFVDLVAWRGTAEFAEKWFKQGDLMLATGRLQTRRYIDKDGNKRKGIEVNVETVNFCEGRKPGGPKTHEGNETQMEAEDIGDEFMSMSETEGEDFPFI